MSEALRAYGYVKLAKLWEEHRAEAIDLHTAYFQERCLADDRFELSRALVDITGNKHVYKRLEMVKLLKACNCGEVDVILTPSRAYLAPNTEEFCYLIKYIMELPCRIDIVSDDDDLKIDTILNVENQRENLYQMAEHYIKLRLSTYEEWKNRLIKAMNQCEER